MNTPSQPGATSSVNTQDTVNTKVASAVTAADSVASQSLQTLGLVHQARVAQFTRIANNAVARYGPTSPQAVAAQAAVKTSQATVARISAVHLQVSAPLPKVTATGWALYGHVYNAQLKPVSAYTVFLVDQEKAYQSAYGFAYTDSTGSFEINYPGSSQAPATIPLFLEIANANAMPVYIATVAFQPSPGSATYQDVTLPAGEPIIGDPPPAIRAIALPTVRKPVPRPPIKKQTS